MKKRIIFTCVVAVVAVFLLIGCGRKDAYVISGETVDETISDEILTDAISVNVSCVL